MNLPEPPAAPQPPARVLILPGWLNSDASHWQSRWEHLYGDHRVEQDDWQWPRRGDWMARLEDVLAADPAPAWLVAHSLGCHLVNAWAGHSRHTVRVAGALLVAPPDLERDDMPPQIQGRWRPIERRALPFPALVVYSEDDPYCSPDRARGMAAAWGCPALSVGHRGHINGQSGLGDWPQGRAWLTQLQQGGFGTAPPPRGPSGS